MKRLRISILGTVVLDVEVGTPPPAAAPSTEGAVTDRRTGPVLGFGPAAKPTRAGRNEQPIVK